jgi:hypothetical protein
MCSGGRLLADFLAGGLDEPKVPEAVQRCLTQTVEGDWVVWARKVARGATRDRFMPMTGGSSYPADAVAECRWLHRGRFRHDAPQPDCTCGFHALSDPLPSGRGPLSFLGGGLLHLDVALSGRVLAFEWQGGGVLFRAARQTVIRVESTQRSRPWPPADPSGWLAVIARDHPSGAGPVRLRLPQSTPPVVKVKDDAGYCAIKQAPARAGVVLTTV